MLTHEIKFQWFVYVGRFVKLICNTRICWNKLKIIFADH